MCAIKKESEMSNLNVSNQHNSNNETSIFYERGKSKRSEHNYRQLGNKIKELRESHNLTQSGLSQQLGVTSTYVSLIEQGKKGGADKLLLKIEDFFKLEHQTLVKLRDAQNTDSIQEEKQKEKQKPKQKTQPKPELELLPENKTNPHQYPTYIQNFVDVLLSYGEVYAKQKVPTWIKELQEEFFNRLTPFDLEEVKQHVMDVKRNWFEVTKRSDISEEDTQIIQGYITQNNQKQFFSLQLNKYALTLNLLQSDEQSIQHYENWLGACSISYLTSEQLASVTVDNHITNYIWFSPHVSITEMYSYLKNLAINIDNITINDHRLNWYLHELTTEGKET